MSQDRHAMKPNWSVDLENTNTIVTIRHKKERRCEKVNKNFRINEQLDFIINPIIGGI